ncbi:MAG: D-alanyl-D-alanine carboxypeptidase/D-alanyl-D-alanine endopeptidase [Gammaproteobacteria bacterium]
MTTHFPSRWAYRQRAALLALLCGMVGMASAGMADSTAEPPPAIAKAIERSRILPEHLGIYVHETGSEAPWLALGADQVLNPGSVMKLVTSYAALELLGPAYTWKTEVYASGQLTGERLPGDLILKGYGDPKLGIERFVALLRGLRQRGICEIAGDLVLDRGYFAIDLPFPSNFDDDPYAPYNAPPDALLLNLKAVQLNLVPDLHGGVSVIADPKPAGVQVINRLASRAGACAGRKQRSNIQIQSDADAAVITVVGNHAPRCGEAQQYASVLGHAQYVFGVFQQVWNELGGQLKGGLRVAPVPRGARLVMTARSPPLPEVLRDINKFSNNVMARQLFLTLGTLDGAPSTLGKSQAVVQRWFGGLGLDARHLIIDNGSGLSRTERISARQLGRLLVHADRSPLMPELVSTLPIAAVDGTLWRRFRRTPLAGRAHLKTGSLSGVKAIGGYVHNRYGRRVVVVCIANDARAAASTAIQDALLQWAYEGGPQGAAPPVAPSRPP